MKLFLQRMMVISSLVWLMSCINTSYSRLDEIEITNKEVDLIVGQFAHHGEAFYQHEVKRTKELLKQSENDFVARNDLASAYIKLERYQEALDEFEQNEKLHPGKYETAANLGVLYKKMGKYQLAAQNIQRSLEIKPEGHMGLGDYYLKMIEWLGKIESSRYATDNFLGISYADSAESTGSNPKVNKTYLLTLIKNDYQFPDVYFVLGDVYVNEGNLQLAMRCYCRAIHLKHPMESLALDRLEYVHQLVRDKQTKGQIVESVHDAKSQMFTEFRKAAVWLEEYQAFEKLRLEQGLPVDFKSMKQVGQVAGMEKPKIIEAMIYKGEEQGGSMVDNPTFAFSFILICGVLLVFMVFLVIKLISQKKAMGTAY